MSARLPIHNLLSNYLAIVSVNTKELKVEIMKIIAFFILPSLLMLSCSQQTTEATSDSSSETATIQLVASDAKPNPYYSRTDTTTLHVSDAEWKKVLPPDVYEVARHKDTERAFTGKYWNFMGLGTYYCAACGNKLFRSDAKFASECGWPSFFEVERKNSVKYKNDRSYGMERIEVLCGRCGGHLGHLFDDGPAPTGKRYCMNSIILEFVPDLGAKQ